MCAFQENIERAFATRHARAMNFLASRSRAFPALCAALAMLPASFPAPAADAARGRELAGQYCASCHLLPDPAALTKLAWAHQIQPAMAKWLGLEAFDYEGDADGKLLREAGLFPPTPLVPERDWFAIWDYYRDAASSQPAPQPAHTSPAPVLKQFRAHKISLGQGAPMTSLVKIVPAQKRLYAGDAFAGNLFALDAPGDIRERWRLGSPPVDLVAGTDQLAVTAIGKLFPSDALEGSVQLISSNSAAPRIVLDQLRRPTRAIPADLNGDGRQDFLVCSYGNKLGCCAWFEAQPDGKFEEHILIDRPGALTAEVRDFNGDGRPDVMVLVAQAREAVVLLVNQGRGRFEMVTILEQPPTWGYSGMEIADMDGDGRPDLITANGDNGDFAVPLKGYHGIRIYRNDGTNHFTEKFFYPMHGAYKAVARDFDCDGDLDIAAIAFFPDFSVAAPVNFVYLENLGGWKFAPATFPESGDGRWMVMDAGDWDGDGDEDIVLGSFVRGPTTVPVPPETQERWRRAGASLLWLENLRKGAARR